MDSDPGAAGRLPQGVLRQAGVGAVVLRQGVLDVELSHAGLTGGVRVLDGLLCGGSTGGLSQAAQGRGGALSSAGCSGSDSDAHHRCSDTLRPNEESASPTPPPPSQPPGQRLVGGERGRC